MDTRTPIARLAERIIVGKPQRCAECDADMGVTKAVTCSLECADAYRDAMAY